MTLSGKHLVLLAVVLGAAAGSIALWFHWAYPGAGTQTTSISRADWDPVLDRVVMTGPLARPRDFFRPISQPKYLSIEAADRLMSDAELVLGLHFGDRCLAYPINLLNSHEMVREEIAGTPLLVTW